MTLLDAAEGVLRVFGALYVVGAVFLFRQLRADAFMDRAIEQLEAMAADFEERPAPPRPPEDPGRTAWMAAGGVLLIVAGVTMTLGLRVSVVALAVLTLHQMAYFVRQRRRELRAASAEEAEEARPTPEARNGFISGLIMLVLAAGLERAGALS